MPVVRALRSESRVTAIATPRSSTISPTICAPNSELPSDSGIRDESATGWARFGSAWGAGTGDGAEEGLICGNKLAALPPGIVVDTPATAGSAPIGMLVPTPSVVRDRPPISAVTPPGVVPDEPPVEPPMPAEDVVGFDVVGVGVGDAVAGLATVTVTLSVAVTGEEAPFFTEMVAVYLIVSPAGAFFGTATCIST